jgi:CCR4-NOT transcription complex subunit 9
MADSAQQDDAQVVQLIHDVLLPQRRESALFELSKRRESFEDLAPILWYSHGTLNFQLKSNHSGF